VAAKILRLRCDWQYQLERFLAGPATRASAWMPWRPTTSVFPSVYPRIATG